VDRLANISESNGEVAQSIVYGTENFTLPAYATVFGHNLAYEYAQLDKEQYRIICIFTRFASWKDMGVFQMS
jgi:hypothetical protein